MDRKEINKKLAEFTAETLADLTSDTLGSIVRLHDITGIPTDVLVNKFCEGLKSTAEDFLKFCKEQDAKKSKEELDIE